MKITYDLASDVMCIALKKGRQVDSIEIAPGVILMLDEKEDLLEMEIIDASEKMGKQQVDHLLMKYNKN